MRGYFVKKIVTTFFIFYRLRITYACAVHKYAKKLPCKKTFSFNLKNDRYDEKIEMEFFYFLSIKSFNQFQIALGKSGRKKLQSLRNTNCVLFSI